MKAAPNSVSVFLGSEDDFRTLTMNATKTRRMSAGITASGLRRSAFFIRCLGAQLATVDVVLI